MARRIVATLKQQHEIALLLSQYCSTDENGNAVYKEGWNDLAIATAVNEKLPNEVALSTEKQVETRRREIYGHIYSNKKVDLENRITALEGIVEHLTKQFETLAGARYVKYQPPIGRPRSSPPD